MFQHEETGRTMFVEAQQLDWGFEKGNPRLKKIGPVYTTPPQPQSEARGLSQSKPLTDEKISLIAHNIDSGDWNDLNFKECWHEGFKAGFREAGIEHNIKE
jgi:hypothetical protein